MQHDITPATSRRFRIKRHEEGQSTAVIDDVAAEEPLAIYLNYWFKDKKHSRHLALTMRTPGNDRELVAGYLVAEGLLSSASDLASIQQIGGEESNEIAVELTPSADIDITDLSEGSLMHSSCGICGRRSKDSLSRKIPAFSPAATEQRWSPSFLKQLPDMLREKQSGFAATGGLHAALACRSDGTTFQVFEDIGRHNALDKLIGHCFLQGHLPLSEAVVFMSSRSSFELIQKTTMAGAKVLATVGAPSSLAVETARSLDITLLGFVRSNRFNVYSGEWRVEL
jgi:FdhD protein